MKILVIDDNADGRGVAVKMLEQVGFEVVTCDSGTAALKYVDEHSGELDGILADLAMPAIDGLTLVQNIRINEAKRALAGKAPIRIAFYSARNKDPATVRVMEKEHVEKFFEKPNDTPDLGAKVRMWLSQSEGGQTNDAATG